MHREERRNAFHIPPHMGCCVVDYPSVRHWTCYCSVAQTEIGSLSRELTKVSTLKDWPDNLSVM